ncbi:thiol-disulfide oxidoreductase ResA [Ferrovum sp. JA12]|uniref:thioredoxin family protein n=1 Tax=Ferrovum sp. JA12 TaxID=1356299 RepID=UPI0007034684|nr:thioredoxin family protein [Ferrovum sp. JA12]KRH79935.1 thiol-disulfide oxidoreductase ResA [Ferrovum sp. JA12]
MPALTTPICDFNWVAPDFSLTGVDKKTHTLQSTRGENGLLVMFICNHCPYVKAIIERLCEDCRELQSYGINSIAIMSNDTNTYPEDSFENMAKWAKELDFPFPYVFDNTQEIAKQYGAVCTPDFFGFNHQLKLQYRGRLDPYGLQPAPADRKRELFDAMSTIAQSSKGPFEQIPSVGCSIKWS